MTEAAGVKRRELPSWDVVYRALRIWRRAKLAESVDQQAVVDKLREESALSARYVFMTAMSAGIAVLGLLLSSPAVVIGAMLLSPLMGPILGAGFALAIGDAHWLRSCAKVLGIGTIIAILFCTLIVFFSPLQTVTQEIASRTRPNLFDLAVALFSALAGSYAMIRGREGTIVGVAIATALMPPLAVVGYGLATGNWTVFGGSLMLFITNLMTIALTAAVMARFYGFRSNLSPHQTLLQTILIVLSFVALAIPLGTSLRQIAWETNATRQINGFIKDEFPAKSRISQLDIDFGVEPINVTATVLTPEFRPDAVQRSRLVLQRALGRPLHITINQFRVGADPAAAEAAQIAAAKAQEQAVETERQITDLGERVALVAGVSPNDVLLDRDHRRAMVRAHPIEGTSLAGYRALEQRVASTSDGWSVEIVPPTLPLPAVEIGEDGEPSAAGMKSIDTIAWATKRIGLPVVLSGADEPLQRVAELLRQRGVNADSVPARSASSQEVRASWRSE
jgi:uncharacterized hydrophobic protein (TIGR00271 family)